MIIDIREWRGGEEIEGICVKPLSISLLNPLHLIVLIENMNVILINELVIFPVSDHFYYPLGI